MNYPTSDIQFLAHILRRVPNLPADAAETHRLNEIANKGYSSVPVDPETPEAAP